MEPKVTEGDVSTTMAAAVVLGELDKSYWLGVYVKELMGERRRRWREREEGDGGRENEEKGGQRGARESREGRRVERGGGCEERKSTIKVCGTMRGLLSTYCDAVLGIPTFSYLSLIYPSSIMYKC